MFTRITTENTYQNQKQNKKKLHELTKQEKFKETEVSKFSFQIFLTIRKQVYCK